MAQKNTMMQEIVEIVSEKHCLICRRPALPDGGKFFTVHGDRVYVCTDDLKAFSYGRGIGQMELNSVVLNSLAQIDDEDMGWALKERVYEIVPHARRQVMEASRIVGLNERSPREVYDDLCNTVVGQEYAKRLVSLAVFEHVHSAKKPSRSVVPDKHNVLLVGPSGSGKTLIAHTVARSMEMPFVSADATGFSPTGFQGADADSSIHDMLLKAGGIVATAERGVLFLDEIDKLATSLSQGNREMLNNATQSALLRLLEGKDVKVPASVWGDPNRDASPMIVNTSRVLFFCCGAFKGLPEIVGKLTGYQGRRMGFSARADEGVEENIKNYEILQSASADVLAAALIDYGFTAELVGRLPVVVPLAPLTRDELRVCLSDLDHSIVVRSERLFLECGYALEVEEDAKSEIVETAYKMATGTRALASIVKKAISYAEFDLLEPGPKKATSRGRVIISAATLRDPADYVFEPRKARKRLAAP
jgi:ATP-dependent Clp protease ATP-binding subunit ClpX